MPQKGSEPPARGHDVANDLLADGVVHRWLQWLGVSDAVVLRQSCKRFHDGLQCPQLWEEAAWSWRCTRCLTMQQRRGGTTATSEPFPWRRLCMVHDRLWRSWRGSPKFLRIDLKDELRGQRIANQEVNIVEFLAGDDAIVFGHSHGEVSLWELLRPEGRGHMETRSLKAQVLGVFHTMRSHDVQDLNVWPSPGEHPSALTMGCNVWLAAAVGPNVFVWESCRDASSGVNCVSDGNITSDNGAESTRLTNSSSDARDVLDSPRSSAAAGLRWGHVHDESAAGAIYSGKENVSGTSNSTGRSTPGSPLTAWTFRGTLRHSTLFASSHDSVWTVRLGNCGLPVAGCRRAVTISEDRILRSWSLASDNIPADGCLDGTLLWQYEVGNARQAVVCILPAVQTLSAVTADASEGSRLAFFTSTVGSSVNCERGDTEGVHDLFADITSVDHAPSLERTATVALARADNRTLELFNLETGVVLESIRDVWPSIASSLPQTASYDASGSLALFSSITSAGDGAVACLNLGGTESIVIDDATGAVSQATYEIPSPMAAVASATATSSSPRSHRSRWVSPLAGPGRVLQMAIPVQGVDVLVAIVQESDSTDWLEVWETHSALGLSESSDVSKVCKSTLSRATSRDIPCPIWRRRVPNFYSNPRLVAVGGRRVVLLDPSALLNVGELQVLEWRPSSRDCCTPEDTSRVRRRSRPARSFLRRLALFSTECCVKG
eukprot:TRINITY_DN34283_c0_g1_i1.p1 TRINITY_DN34283_c0_g1~~TRINITY_DN34283_c0_g1_i1.p1  ORF type:complete len:722 (-),score=93.09 TRINITY_DN34283_c0_g1_i1:182-2347(-)